MHALSDPQVGATSPQTMKVLSKSKKEVQKVLAGYRQTVSFSCCH